MPARGRSPMRRKPRYPNMTLKELAAWILSICEETESGCLIWPGPWRSKGYKYGYVIHQGRKIMTHRVILKVHAGEPPEGMESRHSCDDSRCCNPAHLSWGTRRQNQIDNVRRGRRSPKQGILTEQQARSIHARSHRGESGTSLAREFGVHRNTVYSIKNKHQWRWLHHHEEPK